MDIALAQEHHLAEDDLGEGLAWCRQAGWKALASAATRTEAGGTRGGLLMAFRPRIGAGLAPGETEVTLVPGRLMACHVNALSKGGIIIYNVYLWTSEGLSSRNSQVLEVLMAHKAAHGKPWLAGGDFQIEAKTMQKTRWPRDLDAAVVAPEGPTCAGGKGGGSTIDYFMVDSRVKGFFGAASLVLDGPFKPHHPVQVIAKGGWHRAVASYLAKPKAFPKKRLIGPWPEGKNWGPLKGVIREALESHEADPTQRGGSKVELCWRRWCRQAEGEIVANLDLGDEEEKYVGRQKGPRLVMKPVTGWTGTRSKGASTKKGVVARVQATRLGEVVKCIWAARRKEAAGEGVSKLRSHIRRLMLFLGDYMTKHQNEEGCEQWAPKAQQLKQWGLLKEVEKWTEVFTISRWAAEARVMAEVEEHEARSRRQESWQEWVKKASEKGAAGLHSWIKEPRPWVPAAATVGQEITYSPSDVAEDCLGGGHRSGKQGRKKKRSYSRTGKPMK